MPSNGSILAETKKEIPVGFDKITSISRLGYRYVSALPSYINEQEAHLLCDGFPLSSSALRFFEGVSFSRICDPLSG